ncbi:MAG TPA: tetratricopeptide repeat protein [Anaerolineales bacterium]
MDEDVSFGIWLEKRRKALDLTREEFAQKVGCSASALRKIETDERRPSKQLAELLANVLGIPTEERTAFIKIARGEATLSRLKTSPHLPDLSLFQSPQTLSNSIPIPPTSLIGRESELAALCQMLGDPQCRLITLVGPGGIGKTRLAIETISVQRERFANGVYFVSLASLNSPEFIIPAISEALGFSPFGSVDPKKQLFNFLREQEMLIALDNIEHLMEGVNLLAEILECSPGLKLLVTSRERLDLMREWVFEVHGLSLPPATLSEVENYSVVELFVALARRVRTSFTLTEKNKAEVARICRAVDGMPLGIELAAAWVQVLSCAEIANQIEHNVDFLATTKRDMPERHRSLRAVFDHSWILLSEKEQDVLRRLSVFRGGFLRDAAEYVAGASLALLSSLISKSLILRTKAGRYDLHEIVRQFAETHLESDSEEGNVSARAFETRKAHANYYLSLAENAGLQLFGAQQSAWKERLEQEHDNIRATLEWLLTSETPDVTWRVETMLRLASPLHRFWHGRNGNEGRRWLERGIAIESTLAVRVPASVRVRALETASRLAEMQNDYDATQAMLREALALSRESQEPDIVANVLDALGDLAWLQGDFVQAESYYEECLSLRRPSENQSKIALALISIGNAAVERGDFERAESVYVEGLTLSREAGDLRSIAMALYGLGMVAIGRNEGSIASRRFKEALALFDELRNDFDVALCLECLAYMAVMQGRAAQGVMLWGANETLRESLHVSLFGNYRMRRERGVTMAHSQLDEAAFQAAWEKGQEIGWEGAVAIALESESGEKMQDPHDTSISLTKTSKN